MYENGTLGAPSPGCFIFAVLLFCLVFYLVLEKIGFWQDLAEKRQLAQAQEQVELGQAKNLSEAILGADSPMPRVMVGDLTLSASEHDWWIGPVNWLASQCTIAISPIPNKHLSSLVRCRMADGQVLSGPYDLWDEEHQPRLTHEALYLSLNLSYADGYDSIWVLTVNGHKYYLAEYIYRQGDFS